jgi:hypothetical protein
LEETNFSDFISLTSPKECGVESEKWFPGRVEEWWEKV